MPRASWATIFKLAPRKKSGSSIPFEPGPYRMRATTATRRISQSVWQIDITLAVRPEPCSVMGQGEASKPLHANTSQTSR